MNKPEENCRYTLTLKVRNQPGVLTRCSHVFGRRGHNIEALHVSSNTDDTSTATMAITASGEPGMIHQVIAQLSKLVDVFEISGKETL